MLPASATRPDALTMPSPETLPLAMPIETVAPLPHSELDEAMRTFQEPSNDAAAAGVASCMARRAAVLVAITTLRKLVMACPCCLVTRVVAYRCGVRCDYRHASRERDLAHKKAPQPRGFSTFLARRQP